MGPDSPASRLDISESRGINCRPACRRGSIPRPLCLPDNPPDNRSRKWSEFRNLAAELTRVGVGRKSDHNHVPTEGSHDIERAYTD
jgi:hypothetical protein